VASEIRKGEVVVHGSDQKRKVEILDDGEGFDPEAVGDIPNHDKVTIIYPDEE